MALSLAAGCAGSPPTPSPSTIATAPVESPLASPSAVPLPSADPTAFASPSAPPTPVPVATPAATPPADLDRIVTRERDGIRVRMELQRNPLPAGELSWVRFTVTNRGSTDLTWMHDGCASVAGAYGISAVAWPMGQGQEGSLHAFKAYALGGSPFQEPTPFAAFSFVPEERLGKGSYGCADMGFVETIKPGESRRQTRWWSGFESQNRSVPPAGPATIFVGAGSYWRGTEPDDHEDTWMRFEVPAWIVATDSTNRFAPPQIIDAALLDPAFAGYLETQDIGSGREAIAWYRADRDVWEVALLVWYDHGEPWIKGVLVDPATGSVLGPLDRAWDEDADGIP